MKKNLYRVMKTGGDNLGGPSFSWWIVLGPGVGRTHYVKHATARDVAKMMNLAFAQGQMAARRTGHCGVCHKFKVLLPFPGAMCANCNRKIGKAFDAHNEKKEKRHAR
jgi:hypothetical protein